MYPVIQNGASDGPPDHGNEDSSLRRTGKLFGGLVADIRRKAPWYLSDFRDGLHIQCLGSAFFMYCGCLTITITFGGLLGTVTNNSIGVIECLVSGAICGVTYHLFSGQPLTVLSSTGPILIFEGIVFRFCTQFGWYYLAFRFWIGFWVFIIFLVCVAFDLSFLVRYITRFVQECFVTLLAFIFIYETFSRQFKQRDFWHGMRMLDKDCVCRLSSQFEYVRSDVTEDALIFAHEDFVTPPSNWSWDFSNVVSTVGDCHSRGGHLSGSGCNSDLFQPEFLFPLFLFLLTFTLLLSVRLLRKTRFLPFRVRSCIGDLAIFAVVFLLVLVDAVVSLRTVKLRMPFILQPTGEDRGWIVDPLRNPWFCVLLAIPPAVLAAILMFIDQHIATVIITRRERKLKKGSGFHLDLLIIAVQILLCSAFGCPWFVGATILSINHIHSLTITSETSAPDGQQSEYLGIREQRVTGILASLLIGGSVFGGQALWFVPMSVLYGVLLYMGVTSLQGLQFVDRVLFFLKRRGCNVANSVFLPTVPNRRVCLFTFIQGICFAVSCVVKLIHMISILFPLTVVAMCVVRKVLDKVFTYPELLYLDDILPGSKREPTDNGALENTGGGLELQATEAACMIPPAPIVITPSVVSEDTLPDTPPPPYDVIVHQTN